MSKYLIILYLLSYIYPIYPHLSGEWQAKLPAKSSGAARPEDLQRIELDDCLYLVVPVLEGCLDVFRVGDRRDQVIE